MCAKYAIEVNVEGIAPPLILGVSGFKQIGFIIIIPARD